eukprot:COSAG01_NODE_5528_length_4204_cov_9.376249_6_plen_97_part_00
MYERDRAQKQKKATEDLLADNQQIFTLWNELVCAKEIHADLMRQRRCIAVSYGRPHDSDNTHMTVFYSFLPTTVHTGAPAHDGLGRAALVRRFKRA